MSGDPLPTKPATLPELEELSTSVRSTVIAAWRSVTDAMQEVPLAASVDWVETWLNHYGSVIPHRAFVLKVDETLVGIALLTLGREEIRRWNRDRVWHFGTAGELDADSVCIEYNAIACPPSQSSYFLQQIFARLAQESNWDSLALDGFPAHELPDWIDVNSGWTRTVKAARWVDLNAVRTSGRELITFMGDSTRKSIRQNIRKLGDLRFEVAESTGHALDIFNDMVDLHTIRWNAVGQPGCYASQLFTAFHRELIERLVPREQMLLMRISTSTQVIGCTQLVIDRNRALVYQGGRVMDGSTSPGLVTDFLSMQECYRRNFDAFDFMAGDSMHKRRLTTHETNLVWCRWQRPRWKYQLESKVREGRNWFRQRFSRPDSAPPSSVDE